MPHSPRACRESRLNRGRAPHFAAALALAAVFSLAAAPAHALPSEEGWFRWLTEPLARIVGLFAPEGGRARPGGGAPSEETMSSEPRGLFAQAGAYIDPDGKPAPPQNPTAFENYDQ